MFEHLICSWKGQKTVGNSSRPAPCVCIATQDRKYTSNPKYQIYVIPFKPRANCSKGVICSNPRAVVTGPAFFAQSSRQPASTLRCRSEPEPCMGHRAQCCSVEHPTRSFTIPTRDTGSCAALLFRSDTSSSRLARLFSPRKNRLGF